MPSTDPHFVLTVIPAGQGTGPVRLAGTIAYERHLGTSVFTGQTTVTGGPEDLTARVTSLSYEDGEKESDKLTFALDNFSLKLFSSPLFRTGSIVRASWGYPGNMAPERECVVQKIKGFSKLTVTCFARDALMNKVQRARVFEGKTRHAIVAQVAEENGFGPDARVIDEDPTGEVLEALPQARMTDAQLLRTLATLVGFEFYVDHAGLHWHKRRTGQRPAKVYEYYVTRTRGELLDVEVDNDLFARKTGGVAAKGTEPATKQPIDAKGDNATSTQVAVAPTRDLFTGVDGRDGRVLDTTERAAGSQSVAPTTGATPTAKGAQAAAIGAYDRHQLLANKLKLSAIGDPQVLAKTPIELRGADAAGGKWWVKKATHTLGAGGYKLALECGREGPSQKSGAVSPKTANASKPLPPTDPSSIFHQPGSGLAEVSGVDGRVTFRDAAGQPAPEATSSEDPTAWYRQ